MKTKKKKVTIHDIKQALMDKRFRESLPEELADDVRKFLQNPGCGCNHPIYVRVMRLAGEQVASYFPNQEATSVEEIEKKIDKLARNDWQVINCHTSDLSKQLKDLGPGRKQLDIARFEDQVTVVVNHLEGIY